MSYGVYRGLTQLGGPLIDLYLARRRAAGKEDPTRGAERRGIASRHRPAGPLVWFHAASVGESLSILSLVERLLAASPALHVLVTTGTVTSAQVLGRRLGARAIHQYVPVDRPGFVARFLDHWHPDFAIWVESEIWPNLLCEIRRRRLPAALINARMSDGSARTWGWMPSLIRSLLAAFRLCLAQSEDDAERLRRLGARAVEATGNLKFSAAPLPADPASLAALRGACAGRPVWLLASSHPGEDEVAVAAHQALADRLPGLLTMIAPRHPQRGPEIAELVGRHGLRVARRAAGALPGPDDAVHVADTIGEMGVLYRLAPVVCIGGSLVPRGGQNPIEPAQLGCAVLFGPHMHNFRTIVAELTRAGAAHAVAEREGLADALCRLMTDDDLRMRMADAARAVTERNRRVADRVLEALAPLLSDAGVPTAPTGR